ncbi:mechanosensitive ion channel family protein [Pararobbsia silviterrae]|uniref:Small-conductance mechanosensitive channel n=1 Tax=Pararobbsia silviterrae TaxID=1792498 RepID=A0A494XYX9_9BURK|nr:mechanosensitive ion channel family protein [Pararobbsia silviterrae]RKP55717.1 mechanosensitive ion channel protein MscS [Pararobbsia silviterrae]
MDPLLLGCAIVAADVAGWRLLSTRHRLLQLGVRLVLFAFYTYVLFANDMSPIEGLPIAGHPVRQLASQILEVVWWFLGARATILTLDVVFMNRSWHQERLFQDVLGAIVFLAATVAAVAYVLHWPVRGLIATSGALAIVIGLALQSTLSDLFSGLVINTTQPYQPGDWISIDDVEGTVVEMNWRATHLLTARGNIVVIPNNVAAKAKISNVSRPTELNGISVVVEVTPEARPATVIAALELAVRGCRLVLDTPAPAVCVKRAGTHSIAYEITCFVDAMSKKLEATNMLYDLAHRHLGAAGVDLRPLAVPAPVVPDPPDARMHVLSKIEMFDTLGREDLEQLARRLSRHEYETDQIVTLASDVSQKLLIVAAGVLSVRVPALAGAPPMEIARLGPEEAIGESGVLSGVPMTVDVVAITRVVIFELDKADLTPLLKKRPELGHAMCRVLSKRQHYRELFVPTPAPAEDTETGVFHWLREGMRKLHELTI